MRNDFVELEVFARERGYTVSRRGREIEWLCNSNPDHRGSCFGISDATEEIRIHHEFRLGADVRDRG